MKHEIGISKDKIKYRKYNAYRNYYTTAGKHIDWEDLTSKGFAVSRKHEHGIGEDARVYYVSEKGLELLSELLYIKITEMD